MVWRRGSVNIGFGTEMCGVKVSRTVSARVWTLLNILVPGRLSCPKYLYVHQLCFLKAACILEGLSQVKPDRYLCLDPGFRGKPFSFFVILYDIAVGLS